MFDQVMTVLERGKDNYRSTLRSVDSELRKIVSQDPTQLARARAIQASYGEDLQGCDLAAAEQPAGAQTITEKPKGARKATGTKTAK